MLFQRSRWTDASDAILGYLPINWFVNSNAVLIVFTWLISSQGPTNSWTIHGLWPDHCDGTYDANCDTTRAYTGIGATLQSFGKTDLLAYMNTYWKDYQGDDESFWEHEWAKHGTCISTLKPSCYTSYTAKQELIDYFQKVVDLFKTLPSYTVSIVIHDLTGEY